ELRELYCHYFQNYHNIRNESIKMHFSEDFYSSELNIFHKRSQKCHLCKQIPAYIITVMLKTKGCFYLSSNRKEGIIFGLFMCFGMVLIMSVYNAALHGFSSYTVGSAVIQFGITFIIAFIAESLVEPRARKLALALPYDKSKEINFILAIAFAMVPVMVLLMSVYWLILTALMVGIEWSISMAYLKIIGLNFIVALPSQLLIVGPISRRLLGKYIKPSTQKPVEFV